MNITEDCMALVINAIGMAKRVKDLDDFHMPEMSEYGDMDIFDIESYVYVSEVLFPSGWVFEWSNQ